MQHDQPDDLITPQAAARILSVTDRTIQRWIKDGHLPATRLPGGRLLRIRRADVDALLGTNT